MLMTGENTFCWLSKVRNSQHPGGIATRPASQNSILEKASVKLKAEVSRGKVCDIVIGERRPRAPEEDTILYLDGARNTSASIIRRKG